jgi:hypothetical protein
MSKRQIQHVVLCEDITQRTLFFRYLKASGYETSKIKFEMAPSGAGSAEQFVRIFYPQEVLEYRKRNPIYHRLFVVYDADSGSVLEHEAELIAALAVSGQLPRTREESIVHLIPKRNIETWIHSLLGNEANENDDYKSQYSQRDHRDYCQPAAEKLRALVLGEEFTNEPASLRAGVDELRRCES